MKSFDAELKKYTQKTRLSVSERNELRERILSYMEYHPLRKNKEALDPTIGIASEPFIVFHFNKLYARIGAGVSALALLIGIPLLAEKAIPGDVLYPVKTQINENIQAQFAGTPYQKIAFETSIIERRIAEAHLLANEGKLTDDVQKQLADTVKDHAAAAQSSIAEIRVSNPDGAAIAAITFDSNLQVQSAVLSNASSTATSSTASILSAVNSARQEVAANIGSTTPSFDGLAASVEQETSRAYELFNSVKNTAAPQDVADIQRRLSDINTQIKDANDAHANGDEKANQELAQVLGLTQKLISFMTSITVQQSVDLNALVPMQPTLDERIASVTQLLSSIEASSTRVSQGLASTTNADIRGKVEEGLTQIKTFVASATSSLSLSPVDIDSAENNANSAKALIDDITKLVNPPPEQATSTEETPTTTTSTSTSTGTSSSNSGETPQNTPTASDTGKGTDVPAGN